MMNEQAEKLREKLCRMRCRYCENYSAYRGICETRCETTFAFVDQILKACKESGLVFIKLPEAGEDLTGKSVV